MTNCAYDREGKGENIMLVIEDDSVYEIDEECVRKKGVPKECKVYEKLQQRESKKKELKDKKGVAK